MIKAIIFDCFGVLATEAWLPFKAKHFGQDQGLYEKASQLGWQGSVGKMSYQELINSVAALAKITPAQAHQEIAHNVPNEPLFEYLNDLKRHYQLGFLSNVAANRLNQIFTPEQLAVFDVTILSYEYGFLKPQPEAYQITAHKLGVELAECIFVDDQERQVTGAKEAGMKAILYKNVEQLKKDLAELLKN